MADITSGEFRDFINTVRGEPDKGDCIVTGTVSRIESNRSAWVLIGDNAEATPCSMDVSAHVGDTVTVRIADHKATITGNVTSPATDDRTANRARKEAKVANDTADEALDESKAARASAEIAKQAADAASADAEIARQSAEEAATSAEAAETAATQAISDAAEAKQAADTAQSSADAAQASADSAGAAATEANVAARGAVAGLGRVQDVIGTLDWIREHGTYALTEDTTVDPSKIYYIRSGTAPDYTYTPVAEPKDEELATYYELSIDEAVTEFIGAHLALLNDGLHIVSDANGYYIVLSNDAMRIYDPMGELVAKYGEDIEIYQAGALALKLNGDGMSIYDGGGTDSNNVTAAFGEDGAVVGKSDEFHVAVGANNVAIKYGADRLIRVNSNGTTSSVYMGASTTAPGCKYRNAEVIAYYEMFNSGYRIVPEPDASGRCVILDPDGQTSEFFAIWNGGYAGTYDIKDPDGDNLESGDYAGIYTIEGHEDSFSLNIKLYPQDETPGPVDIEGGDVDVHVEDGTVALDGTMKITGDIIAKVNVDSSASSRSAIKIDRYIQAQDSNGVPYAFLEAQKLTDGRVRNGLVVHRVINGVEKYGSLAVLIDNNGNVSWVLDNPANFRSQLGLGNTTGALPIANGGTGATTASNAVNALTGRVWDFNTENTTDTWMPVATTVNGVGTWRHRVIPTNLATTPTSLWSGNTNANITLSQSVANFTRVTIFYRDNDSLYSSVDVYDPLNKSVLLTSNYNGRYIKSRVVNLNGTAVNSWFYGQTDAVTGSQDSQNLIYITRVLGWKY